MPHEVPVLLEDIREAIRLIEEFTKGQSIADYRSNVMLHFAVERCFIIIGEALTRLDKLNQSIVLRITQFRQIVGFRNVLVHGYETIDDEIVWQVIERDLQTLRKEVNALLAESAGH